MPVYDFTCPKCGYELKDEIAKFDEKIACPKCKADMSHDHPAPRSFTSIIPTYPGSQRYKAGYVHKHGNRPATKTQIGYGGSVSKDHPTGGSKAQD